jgi:quercetin dioxygenase-like cupin family protein
VSQQIKSWGFEQILHNGEYCAKLLVYSLAGIASSLHYHPRKHETFIVQSGLFSVFVDLPGRDLQIMKPGDHVVIPAGTKHRIRCLQPGTIVEASSHDDPADCVRLLPSEVPPA